MLLETYLNTLINLIITKYFVTLPSSCLVHFYNDLTNINQVNTKRVPVVVIQGLHNLILNENCKIFLLQGNNGNSTLGAFEMLEDMIKNAGGDYSKAMYMDRKYLIIINNDNVTEEFSQFFASRYLTFVRDILVVVPLRDNIAGCDLYTHKYTGTSGNNNPVYLDTWYASNMSFAYGHNLYPDKVSNQHGRELRAYCLYGMCKDEEPPLGNEYNVIAKYAERFNFTLISNATDDNVGYLRFNGSGDGLLGGLLRDDNTYSDICYGSYLIRNHVDYILSITFTYEVSVPKPKIKYGLFVFLDTFKLNVWGLIILTMIMFKGFALLHRKYLQKSDDVPLVDLTAMTALTLYGYLVNQPSPLTSVVRRSKLLKYQLLLLLFFSVVLVTAFNSRLASVMVSPVYENDINTLEELARRDLKLLFFDDYYRVLKQDTREVYQALLSKIEVLPTPYDYEVFKQKLESGKYAIARNRRRFGMYDEDPLLLYPMYGVYKTITPDLFTDYYYILLRKNSMHTVELARLVTTANEVGLMQFWEADGAMRSSETYTTDIHYLKSTPCDSIDSNLKMQHLKGIFTMWCSGMVIGMIVFIYELFRFELNRYLCTEACSCDLG